MRVIFSIVYTLYFAVHAYYLQADNLTGDSQEFWGKIWLMSNDVLKLFLALFIASGIYDSTIMKACFVAAIYELFRIVFDLCWLNGWARTDSVVWTILFFIIILMLHIILFLNGRIFKK